mmetsp:Transcript_39630/g.28626  ORF Transcript_39630/g.28626 Transcript_39630/m.28626 type:complete len:132 (-) Transcript_39630:45-440(-)
MGSDSLVNVGWTSPALMACGFFINKNVGSVATSKFFFLSLFMTYIFMSVFGPASGLQNLRVPFPFKWDCFGPNNEYYMGADFMVQSAFYFLCAYHRYWLLFAGLTVFDLMYYGPVGLGGPSAAIVGAFSLI